MSPNALTAAAPINPQQALARNLTRNIADRVFRVLEKHLKPVEKTRSDPLFYAWPREDRAILIFDPASFRDPRALLHVRFSERLAAGVGNRKVVVTLHGGLYVQVAYTPRAVGQSELEMVDLDLEDQPSPFHLPIGSAKKGATWLSLIDMDSVLVGGARRMGKTRVIHGFIQALIRGGQSELLLWDGKDGVEFGRYAEYPNVTAVAAGDLAESLQTLNTELVFRQQIFQRHGVTSLVEYNALDEAQLPALVPVIDELALVPDVIQDILARIIALGGAFGIYPILATQRPGADNIQGLLKANLATRISLPVPDHATSKIILGRTGAEKLPKTKGRLLMVWEAKLIEAQAFRIELPAARTPGKLVAKSLFTDSEMALIQAAQDACDGWFKIKDLAERTGRSSKSVNALAKQWESLGYLTPIQRNARGHTLGRRVTDLALNLAGFSRSGYPGHPDHSEIPVENGREPKIRGHLSNDWYTGEGQ